MKTPATLSLVFLATLLLFSSCSDNAPQPQPFQYHPQIAVDDFTFAPYNPSIDTTLVISLDSVATDTSSVLVFAHVHYRYDSIVALESASGAIDALVEHSGTWTPAGNPRTVSWVLKQSADFAQQPGHYYAFVLAIDALQPETLYYLSASPTFAVTINKRTLSYLAWNGVNSFQTK